MRIRTRLRLWWNRLFVRQDEFHRSLRKDVRAMKEKTPEQKRDYLEDLDARRTIAHRRDLAREAAVGGEK